MRILTVDDEPLARMVLVEYLKEFCAKFPEMVILEGCSNGFEAMKSIQEHKPDLVFLDVQMPKLTGFELLELLDDKPSIIFTTAYDEYAFKAFEAEALDYLLKPIAQDRFRQAMEKWLNFYRFKNQSLPEAEQSITPAGESLHLPESRVRIVVKKGNQIVIIPVGEVVSIDADDDFVKINTLKESHYKNRTLSYFESLLDEKQFIRVHRSHILNISHLSVLEPYGKDSYLAVTRDNRKIPVSKQGYQRLNALLGI